MTEQRVQTERTPVYSKTTHKLMCRVDAAGVHIWNKLLKEWELFTWEELRERVVEDAAIPVG